MNYCYKYIKSIFLITFNICVDKLLVDTWHMDQFGAKYMLMACCSLIQSNYTRWQVYFGLGLSTFVYIYINMLYSWAAERNLHIYRCGTHIFSRNPPRESLPCAVSRGAKNKYLRVALEIGVVSCAQIPLSLRARLPQREPKRMHSTSPPPLAAAGALLRLLLFSHMCITPFTRRRRFLRQSIKGERDIEVYCGTRCNGCNKDDGSAR